VEGRRDTASVEAAVIIGALCFIGGFFLGALLMGLMIVSAAGDKRNWGGE
jgi:hypothetical protein